MKVRPLILLCNATDDLDGDLSSEIMWVFRCR